MDPEINLKFVLMCQHGIRTSSKVHACTGVVVLCDAETTTRESTEIM